MECLLKLQHKKWRWLNSSLSICCKRFVFVWCIRRWESFHKNLTLLELFYRHTLSGTNIMLRPSLNVSKSIMPVIPNQLVGTIRKSWARKLILQLKRWKFSIGIPAVDKAFGFRFAEHKQAASSLPWTHNWNPCLLSSHHEKEMSSKKLSSKVVETEKKKFVNSPMTKHFYSVSVTFRWMKHDTKA